MLKEIHDHMVHELHQNARTDTVFVVAAVLFNLVVLGINWGVASDAARGRDAGQKDLILGLLIVGTVLINLFAFKALTAGKTTRRKIVSGLQQMYADNGVDKYYSQDLLAAGMVRYTLFTLVLAVLAVIAIVVPLIERTAG